MQQFLIGCCRQTTSNVLMGLVDVAASLFPFEWCICQPPRSTGPHLMQGVVNETSVGIQGGPSNSINSSETGCDVVLAVSRRTLLVNNGNNAASTCSIVAVKLSCKPRSRGGFLTSPICLCCLWLVDSMASTVSRSVSRQCLGLKTGKH